ncbi:MAG: cysteine protease [Prevotella sp.]|nr:cysteine protease [Prevotella sp.]
MWKAILITILTTLLANCTQKAGDIVDEKVKRFHTDVLLRTTPVKDQGNSNACWIYAMLATIESEHLRDGDSVNLSATYLCRHALAEQVQRHYATAGTHTVSLKGMAPMTLDLLQSHGAMPYDSYKANEVDFKSLSMQLTRLADSSRAHRKGIAHLNENAEKLFDDALGFSPSWVFMLGCQYTTLEFARSICKKDEYVSITSFTHHPFGSTFTLEVPDNQHANRFLNLPIDSMMTCMEQALRHGHPVCWEGDITETGFSAERGIGELTSNQPVTQESRQRDFDHFKTTDDHCMEMVGIAHDDHQRKYFICKNSWGNNNPYGGFVFLSEAYVKAKTICIVLPRVAL